MIKKVSEIVEMPEYHNIDGAIITRHQHDLVERCVGSQDVGKKQIEAKIDVEKALDFMREISPSFRQISSFESNFIVHKLAESDCIVMSEASNNTLSEVK